MATVHSYFHNKYLEKVIWRVEHTLGIYARVDVTCVFNTLYTYIYIYIS